MGRSGWKQGAEVKWMNLLIDHEVLKAEIELERASADDVIEKAKVYLALLFAFHKQLGRYARGVSRGRYQNQLALNQDPVEQAPEPFGTAIHIAKSEILRVERLLDKFSKISAPEAVEIFNRLGHRGSSSWEEAINEVRTIIGTERMSAETAIEEAGMLLREEYAATNKTTEVMGH